MKANTATRFGISPRVYRNSFLMWYVRELIMKVTHPEPIFGFRVITSVKPIREDSYVWRAHSRGGRLV